MTMHRVAKRPKNSKSLQGCPRLGRPQVIKRETVKKAFDNDPIRKMTKFVQRRFRCPPCNQKRGRKEPKTFEETSLKSFDDSKAFREEHPPFE